MTAAAPGDWRDSAIQPDEYVDALAAECRAEYPDGAEDDRAAAWHAANTWPACWPPLAWPGLSRDATDRRTA
jgi:hypothetical protein